MSDHSSEKDSTSASQKGFSGTARGPFGDARPDKIETDPRTQGGLPEEKVDDRENVSIVTPQDYPAADREISRPK